MNRALLAFPSCVAMLLAPLSALAQAQTESAASSSEQWERRPAAQHGFQLSPGVTLAQVYDDDLGAPGRNAFFTEVTPAYTLGYASQRWTLLSHGALDVEAPDAQPFHNTPFLRGTADAALMVSLSERWTLTANGSVWDTNTPRDLNVSTGLALGNEQANSEAADASLAFRASLLTRASIQAGFVSTSESGLIIDEGSARASVHHEFSPRDGGRADLDLHRYDFLHHSTIDVESPMLGWDRRVSDQLRFEVLAGPRFDDASIEGVESAATLAWLGERVHVSASLATTQTSVAGFIGLVNTESALARVVWRPQDKLYVTMTPAFYLSNGAPLHAQVYEARVDAFREMTPWLALIASYRLTVEHAKYGATQTLAASNAYQVSAHNQVLVGATLHWPQPGLPVVWPTADSWVAPQSAGATEQSWREPRAPLPPSNASLPGAEPADSNGAPVDTIQRRRRTTGTTSPLESEPPGETAPSQP